MTPTSLARILERWSDDWLEPAAFLLPIGVGIALPLALRSLLNDLPGSASSFLDFCLFMLFLVYLPLYCFVRALVRWLVNDEPLVRAFTRGVYLGFIPRSEAKLRRWPILTLSLIAVNVLVFFHVGPWYETTAYGTTELDAALRSVSVCLFLHADGDHLFGNMLWLWLMGAVLEGRMQRRNLLVAYFASGVAAEVMQYLCTYPQWQLGIGASGAISGLVGLFAVRLQFTRVSVPATPLALPFPFAPTVSVPALAFVALHFMRDVDGMISSFTDDSSNVAYGAHVGGFLCGVAFAYASAMWRDALDEWRRDTATQPRELDGGAANAALSGLIARSPGEVDLLLERARRSSRLVLVAEAGADYRAALLLLLARDRRRAARVFAEYFRRFALPLGAEEQLALTPSLAAIGESDLAAQSLELAARTLPEGSQLWARVRLREAEMLAALGLAEPALRIYERLRASGAALAADPFVEKRFARLRGAEAPRPIGLRTSLVQIRLASR